MITNNFYSLVNPIAVTEKIILLPKYIRILKIND
jgi:hypothetical protein